MSSTNRLAIDLVQCRYDCELRFDMSRRQNYNHYLGYLHCMYTQIWYYFIKHAVMYGYFIKQAVMYNIQEHALILNIYTLVKLSSASRHLFTPEQLSSGKLIRAHTCVYWSTKGVTSHIDWPC